MHTCRFVVTLKLMKHSESGIAHLVIIVLLLIGIVSGIGWYVFTRQDKSAVTNASPDTQLSLQKPSSTAAPTEAPKAPDSVDTLTNPEKITSADGKSYFVYGAPVGQNNKSPKKIIISLPGHGTTAEDGYKAWDGHLTDTGFALAEFNWWRGGGEKKSDYYDPFSVVMQVRAFLDTQDYDKDDIVVLHGFSRGSANTYAVIAQDRVQTGAVFDAVISNAGKYQSDFPLDEPELSDQKMTEVFSGMPWVLACGGLDENPNRDGCPGMQETQIFLTNHKARVLGLLTDPNAGHGAFHMSKLGLPKQALQLIDGAL